MKPLAIDLFCGLGGRAEGFLAEGYDVIGFDNERHQYPVFERENVADNSGVKAPGNDTFKSNGKPCNKLTDSRYGSGKTTQPRADVIGWREYPGQLVLQDVLTLHGSQFRNASVIVASPPCQAYSYRAMPWKRAKALPPPSNELFEACFRIQREASEAAGRYIPLVIENVRGAEKWVGAARWHFGSYYLWGDVPLLMPIPRSATKVPGFRFDGSGKSFQTASVNGLKVPGISWSGSDKPGYKAKGMNVEAAKRLREGFKQHGSGPEWFDNGIAKHSSRSDSRKQASAEIAKIPFPLAQHIARVFKP